MKLILSALLAVLPLHCDPSPTEPTPEPQAQQCTGESRDAVNALQYSYRVLEPVDAAFRMVAASQIPRDWGSFDVSMLVWSSATGNVRWFYRDTGHDLAVGATVGFAGGIASVTTAIASANVTQSISILSNVTNFASHRWGLYFGRNGDDGADTLAQPMNVVGLILTRKT